MDKQSFVVAVVPAFNEEKTIAKVVLLAGKHVDRVVVCDDGSMDLTAEIAEGLGAKVIRHGRNMGKGAALNTAFEYVKQLNPRAVVSIDGDGQHIPNEIPKLLDPIDREEADLVVGSRYVEGARTEAPLYRRLGLKLVNFLNNTMGKNVVKDTQSGFRAFSARALDVMLRCEARGYGIETEQIAMAANTGLKVVEVPITVGYRGLGKTSKRNPVRHGTELVGIGLRLIVEERPLVLLGVPGAVLTVLGMIMGAYMLGQFNVTRFFSMPVALITLGAISMGITLFLTSLTLYALGRLARRISSHMKDGA